MDGDRNNFPAETATHQDEIDGTSQPPLIPPPVNNATTLLPSRLASAVSFLAQSTSLTVRIGTLFGGAALGSARATTLTGLELSRALVETILTKAGRDVVGQAQDEYGKVEAESILERSVRTSRPSPGIPASMPTIVVALFSLIEIKIAASSPTRNCNVDFVLRVRGVSSI